MKKKVIEVQNRYLKKKSTNVIVSPSSLDEMIKVVGEDKVFQYARDFWEVKVRAEIRNLMSEERTNEDIQRIPEERYGK